MTPHFKALLAAIDELNILLEGNAHPHVCLPKSVHIEGLLRDMPGDRHALVPVEVATALTRMAQSMADYRDRSLSLFTPLNRTLQ